MRFPIISLLNFRLKIQRNTTSTRFLQQILGGRLLRAITSRQESNFSGGFKLKTCNNMPSMICCENVVEWHFSIIYGIESIEVKTFTCFVGYIYCQFDSFLDEMLVLDSKYLVINVQVLNMLYVGKLRTKTCLGLNLKVFEVFQTLLKLIQVKI